MKQDGARCSVTINAGGWVEARSKTKDVVATATTVHAQGNIALIADLGNISEVAGLGSNYSQSYSKSSYVFGLFGSSSGATSSSTVVAPSFVSAKGDLTYYAHGDLKIVGSGGQSGGTTYVTATNVNVTAVEQLIAQGKMSENWGLFASASAGNGTVGLSAGWKDTKTTSSELQSLWQAASLQAGGRLVINATGDVNVFGSTVTAAGGITVNAAQVNVTAAQDTIATQSNTTTDTIGLMPAMNNGLGFAIGAREVSDTGVQTTVASVGGLIGSTGGAVVINASEGINVQGGVIGSLQADSTILNAPSISVSASVDSFTAYALHTDKFVGLNVSIEAGAANPLSGVQKGASYLAAAENTKDPQAKLLYEAAAGAQGAQGLLNLYKAESAGSLAQAFASFDIKVGIGVAVSSSESTYHTEQASGGMVLAAKNAVLNATGGDLTLTGATIYAPSVTLSAQRDIVQQSLALTTTASSKSTSFSAFAGVDFGMGLKDGAMAQTGFGLTASVSDFAAQSQTVSVTHAQTTVSGGFVSLNAGRDIDLYGAAVSAGGIAAQAGRNLNIVSDQDTERETASLTSWSLGGTIGLTGMPSSFNAGYASGNASGNYTSVTATSGLFAGSGGYAVTVGGTTTLTGGALASTADASKNSLTTGALVTKDLVNSSGWKASSSGMSASYSTGGIGGIQPGLSQKTGGSSSGVAQATIAPGTVSIVNASLQKSLTGKTPEQVIAALNRASAAQNKAADTLPGSLAQTLQNQADRSLAMIAASSSTAKLVGDVSTMFRDSALQTMQRLDGQRQPDGSLTPELQKEYDAAQAQYDLFKEGGTGRALLHGATQGVLAYIGGGYSLDAGLRGAAGATLSSWLGARIANQAQKLLNGAGLGDNSQTKPGPLASLVAELAVTGIASSFGNTAALTAAAVDIANRQMTKEEGDLIRKLARQYAESRGLCDANGECSSAALNQAQGELTLQVMRDAGKSAATVPFNQAAADFLRAQPEYGKLIPEIRPIPDYNLPPNETYFTASKSQTWFGYYSLNGTKNITEYADDLNNLDPRITQANSDLYAAASKVLSAQTGTNVDITANLLNLDATYAQKRADVQNWVVPALGVPLIVDGLLAGKAIEPGAIEPVTSGRPVITTSQPIEPVREPVPAEGTAGETANASAVPVGAVNQASRDLRAPTIGEAGNASSNYTGSAATADQGIAAREAASAKGTDQTIKGGAGDTTRDDLPTGFQRITEQMTGEIKIAGPDGKIYDRLEDVNWAQYLKDNAKVTNVSGTVNSSAIRWTQDSIGANFKDGSSMENLITGLKNGTIDPQTIPPARVFEVNGELWTLDHRRTYAFSEAGVPIQVVPATEREIAKESLKFTTNSGGSSIVVRGK